MENTSIFTNSIPVDADTVRKTGAFTTLPVRIHKHNVVADKATLESIKDWHDHIGDNWETKSGSACSPVGNWCSFIFSEALPERLASITYLTNLGNIHDGTQD